MFKNPILSVKIGAEFRVKMTRHEHACGKEYTSGDDQTAVKMDLPRLLLMWPFFLPPIPSARRHEKGLSYVWKLHFKVFSSWNKEWKLIHRTVCSLYTYRYVKLKWTLFSYITKKHFRYTRITGLRIWEWRVGREYSTNKVLKMLRYRRLVYALFSDFSLKRTVELGDLSKHLHHSPINASFLV